MQESEFFLKSLKADEQKTLLENLRLGPLKITKLSNKTYALPHFIKKTKDFIPGLLKKIISDKIGEQFVDEKFEAFRNPKFAKGKPTKLEKLYEKVKSSNYTKCIIDLFHLYAYADLSIKYQFKGFEKSFLTGVEHYLNTKLDDTIVVGPVFLAGNLIHGKADLIAGDELIFFFKKETDENIILALISACLCSNETGTKINKIVFYNPFKNTEASISIAEWNYHGELFNWIYSFVSGKFSPKALANLEKMEEIIFDYLERYKYTPEYDQTGIFVSGQGIKKHSAIIVLNDMVIKHVQSVLRIHYSQRSNLIFYLERFFTRIRARGHYILSTNDLLAIEQPKVIETVQSRLDSETMMHPILVPQEIKCVF